MSESDLSAFIRLFQEAYVRCFGHALAGSMTEAESKRMSIEIEQNTGLVVGWKSVKNYAAFIAGHNPGKRVNPSTATLDTLARYVAAAPATTEIRRKKNEAHYPFWFEYRDAQNTGMAPAEKPGSRPADFRRVASMGIMTALGLAAFLYFRDPGSSLFADDFHSVENRALRDNGWWVQSKMADYWARKGENPGELTLFTLPGDNWPQQGKKPGIRNLLLRKIPGDCFAAEVHLKDFIPTENWQQAGILLMEDTTFSGKSIRVSIAYNDFFGGYTRPGEIIIQAISSYGKGYSNPEEILHHTLFSTGGMPDSALIADNLRHSAFRIEKKGNKFRFLYAVGQTENFSFRELSAYEFDMNPRFAGLFALKGFVDSTAVIPVQVRFFRLDDQPCN